MMSSAVTVGGFKPVFHRCLVGFKPSEVLTFCSQVIRDFERTVRELEEAQHELQALKNPTDQAETVPDRVARILLSTERIADEIESRARDDSEKLLAEARVRATDVIRDAERRAAGIIEAATSDAAEVEKHVLELRNHCFGLRAAFERAAETATRGLNEIDARGFVLLNPAA
jgi:cell division septum initiation protein DivIVA